MTELSIVVYSRGNAAGPGRCLAALAGSGLEPSRAEFVVVGPQARSASAFDDLPHRVTTVDTGSAGADAAFSQGAARARGEYCLFLDERTVAGPALLGAHLAAQREHGGAVALGPLDFRTPRASHPFARYLATRCEAERLAILAGNPAPTLLGCERGNVSVPRTAFLDAGRSGAAAGATLSERVWRLTRAQLPAVLVRGATAEFECEASLALASARVVERGASEVALFREHADALPHLQLATFGSRRLPHRVPHRLLLAASLPVWVLAGVARLAGAAGARGPAGPWSLLYEHLYWRGVRRAVPCRGTWDALTSGVVILLYHACGVPGERGSRYVVPGERFAWQMRWLARRGYRVLALDEYLRCRAEHRHPPPRSVVITFDDGYADNLSVAHPVLRSHGFSATVFVVTSWVGRANGWDPGGDLAGRPLLTWRELKDLAGSGFGIGAHTRSHSRLPTLDDESVEEEVAGSRADIERRLAVHVGAFAYPGGMHDARSEGAVARAGYVGACSTRPGLNDAGTATGLLRRVDVHGGFSRSAFAWSLAFGTFPPWLRWRSAAAPRRGAHAGRGAAAGGSGPSGDR